MDWSDIGRYEGAILATIVLGLLITELVLLRRSQRRSTRKALDDGSDKPSA